MTMTVAENFPPSTGRRTAAWFLNHRKKPVPVQIIRRTNQTIISFINESISVL